MKVLVAVVVCLAVVPCGAEPLVLMPYPKAVSQQPGGLLTINGPFAATWAGCGAVAPLERAAARLNFDIARQTGLMLDTAKPSGIAVRCQSTVWAADAGEGYHLSVTTENIAVEAEGPIGVLRAFATLRQMAGLSTGSLSLPSLVINDAPRFPWRSIMLDPARHFLTVATLKRQIDAMERVKMNTLHLHLSDDQGFRVESLRYPKLTADGQCYTQAEIRDLVAYAGDRGVRIVPEFDLPGHTRAVINAYPELGKVPRETLYPGSGVLNPASPQTYVFLDGLIAEMTHLFPDPHFHVGGDEVADGAWNDMPEVNALMSKEGLKNHRDVQAYFERRVLAMVRHNGKVPMGWEEVLNGNVPADVMVEVWQTSNKMAASTAAGHKTLMASGYYLNLLMPADFLYAHDPAATNGTGVSADQAEALRKKSPLIARFLTDAMVDHPHAPLTAEQEKLLLGGEAALWGEMITDGLVDHVLWPRAAVLAERFWSPENQQDTRNMYLRLAVVSDELTVSGLDDQASEARMMARLAPGESGPVATLLSTAGPTRNFAHDHEIQAILAGKSFVQSFNQLADAAPVDSLPARIFFYQVKDFVGGERAFAAPLQAQLILWRDNDARYQQAASGNADLAAALPVSAQVAQLAEAGLSALAAIQAGTPLAAHDQESASAVLQKTADQEDASSTMFGAFSQTQPPADLIIKIGPAIRLLVDAAAGKHPST